MENNLLDVFLNLVCKYFIENFLTHMQQQNQPVISVSCVLAGFSDTTINTGFIK